MTDLFQPAGRAGLKAARYIAPLLGAGTPVTRQIVSEAMTAAYGGNDADS